MGKSKKNKEAKREQRREKKVQQKKAFVARKSSTNWMPLLIAVIATLLAYNGLFDNEYINYDDDLYVYENPLIQNMEIGSLFSNLYESQYSPVAMTLSAIQYKISDSIGFIRFGSLLFHLINIGLVFLIFRRLCKEEWMAGVMALLFAVHPIQVESVAWLAASMKIGAYALFFLLGIWTYLKYLDKKDYKYLACSVFIMLLSCMSKEQAVALPLALLAIDYLKGRSLFSKAVVLEKVPYFALSLIFGLITLQASSGTLESVASIEGVGMFGLGERMLLVFHTLALYIYKIFLPYQLSFFYTYPVKGSIPPQFYISAIVALALLATTVYAWIKDKKYLAFGLLFFFVNVVFTSLSSLMAVRDVLMADRYVYIAILGVFFLFVHGLGAIKEKLPFQPQYLAYAVAGVFVLLTITRVEVFESSHTLFSDVIAKESYASPDLNPYLGLPYNNRGVYYRTKGRTKDALNDFNKSIKVNPKYSKAYLGRGTVYFNSGEDEKALRDYNKALELDPENKLIYSSRGSVYAKTGQYDRALRDFDTAIAKDPNYLNAISNRSLAHYYLDNFDEAIQDTKAFLKYNPSDDSMIDFMASCYSSKGDYESALRYNTQAIKLSPKSSYYTNRAGIYDAMGNSAAASADRLTAQRLGS